MPHLVLLGDSIFDNAAYVGGGPDVIQQLRALLPPDWQASLVAVDGSVATDVKRQLEHLPGDATHLFVSAGGNDALRAMSVIDSRVATVGEALAILADVQEAFASSYRVMLTTVLSRRLPVSLCTIYAPRFPDANLRRSATAALSLFNDPIMRLAAAHDLPLIDLRAICNEDADFANPIEPSVKGGGKIAKAILDTAHQQNA